MGTCFAYLFATAFGQVGHVPYLPSLVCHPPIGAQPTGCFGNGPRPARISGYGGLRNTLRHFAGSLSLTDQRTFYNMAERWARSGEVGVVCHDIQNDAAGPRRSRH